jgi:hypothetical protein
MTDLLAYLAAALAFAGAVFFAGRSSGYKKAQGQVQSAKNETRVATENAAAAKGEADARINAVEDARNVQQETSALSDAAVDQQLLEHWGRDSSGR